MIEVVLQYVLYFMILILCAIPLGTYIRKVMNGERTVLSKVFNPVCKWIYKILGINQKEEMDGKTYAKSVLTFSFLGFVFLFVLLLLQGKLPGNPQKLAGVNVDLAFNLAASFITNTNWQGYCGESTLSYFTQSMGLTVQKFFSAAVGMAVLFSLIRGFVGCEGEKLGNFWVDLTRIVIHILLPLNFVLALLLVSGGVIQNFDVTKEVELLVLLSGQLLQLLHPMALLIPC